MRRGEPWTWDARRERTLFLLARNSTRTLCWDQKWHVRPDAFLNQRWQPGKEHRSCSATCSGRSLCQGMRWMQLRKHRHQGDVNSGLSKINIKLKGHRLHVTVHFSITTPMADSSERPNTHAKNATQHPGLVVRKQRRTKREMEEARALLKSQHDANEQEKLDNIAQVASLEDQMVVNNKAMETAHPRHLNSMFLISPLELK